MSFKANSCQQISLNDVLFNLTERETKVLEKSWAKSFAEHIFPAIDEKPFAVLYGKDASRPNTPVNVIIGALILKEMLGLTDDEVVESLMFDIRFQYALHTTSFKEQPLSDRTLSRFRQRCLTYATTNGIDLMHACITGLSAEIAAFMKINGTMTRMDSAMIESNIKKLGRLELIYICVAKFILYLHKQNLDSTEEIADLAHYIDPADYNRVIYHNKNTSTNERLSAVIADATKLTNLFSTSCGDVAEYQLLVRVLNEQTKLDENGNRCLKTKEDGEMNASMLQNPADPEATYRKKAGKEHRGYVANFTEAVGKNGSVVTDYQAEQNTYSDSKFLSNAIEKAEKQEDNVTIVADGAYSSQKLKEAAAKKNITIHTTDLLGKKPEDINADFEFNHDGTTVTKCPNGCSPKSCCYSKRSKNCRVSFYKSDCEKCPYFKTCQPKESKQTYYKFVSEASAKRAQTQRNMKTEEFKNFAKLRNGIETIPSILRRKFNIDKLPVRGLVKLRFWLGTKIGALNFKKLFNYISQRGNYAQNPILT